MAMAAVETTFFEYFAIKEVNGFLRALIAKWSNSDSVTDRDNEEGELPGEGEVHLEAGVLACTQ